MRALPLIFLLAAPVMADEPWRVLPEKEKSTDARLGKPKDLNGYFPFAVPATREAWEIRSRKVREQVLVANGLWPMPEKTPLQATIHGKIEREGYTIEKVSFVSMPGHYVTGNLYRPTGPSTGKRPGVLFPHGHFENGRFYDAGEAAARRDVASKAEDTMESARYPLQALPAGLARMGCVVFHYDMVGYADSQALTHRLGFKDAEAELRGQSFQGLQTWNSIRALDFITSLPDVDSKRIGVTGASGGGTQTFLLCAVDDRPAVAFPAVMVSTAMQGGCVCENCSNLRVGTGNVEIAGLFAPKPLAMSAAHDWTVDLETKGLPELKQLYRLYGAEEEVDGKCWKQYGHNYNQRAREFMYSWFDRHLLKGKGAVSEKPFKPVPIAELSVYDAEHPRPKDELNAADLRKVMTERSEEQMKALYPKDAKSLERFRNVLGTALHVMVHDSLPSAEQIEFRKQLWEEKGPGGIMMHKAIVGRKGEGDAVPMLGLIPEGYNKTVVIWLHPQGKASLFEKGSLAPAAQAILDKKAAILSLDAFQTGELKGEKPFPVDPNFAGFTYGYNPSVLAQRVHDVLTAVTTARSKIHAKSVYLVGWEESGIWAIIAKNLAGDAVDRTVADAAKFRFEDIKKTDDEMMLPGAVKYGGLPAFCALCAPGELFMHNNQGTGTGQMSKAAYEAAGATDKLKRIPDKATAVEVVTWLFR